MDLDEINKCPWPRLPVQLYERRDAAFHTIQGQWDKAPLIKGWPSAATTDPRVINEWFGPGSRWAPLGKQLAVGALMGTPIPAEPLFVHVVDVDPRNGGTVDGFPETLTVKTISGGFHLYCSYPEPLRNGIVRQGVDFKGQGGFVVVPPSFGYSYVDPNTPIAPLPEWIAQNLRTYHRVSVDGPVPNLPDCEPLPLDDRCIWSFWCDVTEEEPIVGSRSSRTNWFMKRCRELELTDGQIRTAVWQYPPAVDKENEKPGWLNADLLRFMAGQS